MKNYYRIMLGAKSAHVQECLTGNFIGVDFGVTENLTSKLSDQWNDFKKEYVPVYLKSHPLKKKIAAGLACGTLWVVSKGINIGDIVLCHDGNNNYLVGEITGPYFYEAGKILPHRRPVKWYQGSIPKSSMSQVLRNSIGSIGTYCMVSKHGEEIEALIGNSRPSTIFSSDETIEDPSVFALETHLEEFLVTNWDQTKLSEKYDIYKEEGEPFGKQFPVDTGKIDILAISKDQSEWLVIELKKGRASDIVVGQILRYMGHIKEDFAETNQTVRGIIIALEDDQRIRSALSMTNNIEFYRYKIDFDLFKVI
jgi:restriction system protein